MVDTEKNVSEKDQVFGSRGGKAIYSTSLHKLVLLDKTGLGWNYTIKSRQYKSDLQEGLNDYNFYEIEIDKRLVEANGAKSKYN